MDRLCYLLIAIMANTMFLGVSVAETPTTENTTIKTVMTQSHSAPPKGSGLLKKVATGKASAEETKQLLALYKVMAKLQPPKGDADAWKERSGRLVNAVQAVIDGSAEGAPMLAKASNCKACHDAHKN